MDDLPGPSAGSLFEGFEPLQIATSGATINLVRGGSGPPLLLLHGWPETLVQWHRIAPALAERFTVVATDLRGHGDSSKPPGGEGHRNYAKRVMAQDQVEVMAALGFDRFHLAGHDRGARVAHRLALDHPGRVERLALLDIAPTLSVVSSLTQAVATGAYHWFFLIQPAPLPETLIGGDPEFYLRWHLRSWSGGEDAFFDPRAVAEYIRCFSEPATIHATCEDLRALMSIDLEHDRANLDRRIECPLFVLWGSKFRSGDLRATWLDRARDVSGHALDCGHFLAEERPDETAAALLSFFSS